MPEYRRDPLTGYVVMLAPERASRPHDFTPADEDTVETTVFAEGNEHNTPPEVYADRPDEGPGSESDGPGWHVRVVPNRYPAVALDAPLRQEKPRRPFPGDELFPSEVGFGAHEVVVECPQPGVPFHQLGLAQIRRVLSAYRHRAQAHKHDGRFHYLQVFKNVGHRAGASVAHPHSQIVALPFVPEGVERRIDQCQHYRRDNGAGLFDHWIDEEIKRKIRQVDESKTFVALCPFGSRFVYEVLIAPKPSVRLADLAEFEDGHLDELAALLERLLMALAGAGRLLEYNIALFNRPWEPGSGENSRLSDFRWHLSIMPRLSGIAGLEISTGCYINTVLPEQAATDLRQQLEVIRSTSKSQCD